MGEEVTASRVLQQQPDLLDQLYQTPSDNSRWSRFLESLVDACESRSARLLVLDRTGREVLHSTKVNIDDHEHRDYVDYYVNRCPWRPEMVKKPPGRFYSSYYDCSCPQDEFYRSEFFNDWARHLDIEHGLSSTLYTDSRYTVQLLIQRTGGQGPFDRHLAQQLDRYLAPHLRQALHLGRTAAMEKHSNLSALKAAERSFMPFLLVDALGHSPYQCSRALTLLDQLPGIALEQGQLQFRVPRQRALFFQALKATLNGPEHSQKTLIFPLEGRHTPVRLLLTPLLPGYPSDSLWPESAVAAVYLQDPAMHLDVDHELLAQLFGLTQAEAKVAARIALGADPKGLAERHQVSVHTIRAQLKSVMHKMGVCRQVQMAMRVFLSAAARDRNLADIPFVPKD